MKLKMDELELRTLAALDAGHFRKIVTTNLRGEQIEILEAVESDPGGTFRGSYVDPVESHRKRERAHHRRAV